jgi:uncharacterized caspase-like protein
MRTTPPRLRRVALAVSSALFAAACFAQPVQAESRVALVIGNSTYKISPLKNPAADAQAVAAALKSLGFDVTERENTSYRELIELLRQFSKHGAQADVRLVFYAGHGVQAKGRNYLLPVDTEIRSEEDIPAKSADVNDLLDRLAQISRGINIVILDACRDNPFAGSDVVLPDGRRLKFRGATPSGLARMEAPLGTLLAFSTAPGGIALDDPAAAHSIYAKYLLDYLGAPGLPVEQMFKRVRAGVANDTGRMQVPWESSSLTGDFCFKAEHGTCVIASGPPR